MDANVSAGIWNGGASPFGKSDRSQVMIHPDFLRKMYDDPEVGGYYEDQINLYAKGDQANKQRIEAQGGKVLSTGMYVNEEGEMTAMMSAEMPSPGDKAKETETTKTGKKKTAKEAMEELLEKLQEKKQAEKAEPKAAAEKAAAAELLVGDGADAGDATEPAVDVYA